MEQSWIDLFNTDTFQISKDLTYESGLNYDSVRIIEMISSFVSSPTFGEKAAKKVGKAL